HRPRQALGLGPQPGDLLVAIIGRSVLEGGLAAGQEVVAPAGEGGVDRPSNLRFPSVWMNVRIRYAIIRLIRRKTWLISRRRGGPVADAAASHQRREPPRMATEADRHFLVGLLALQVGLIDQVQLVSAFHAWTRDKARPLADHLQALGHLNAEQRGLVEALA